MLPSVILLELIQTSVFSTHISKAIAVFVQDNDGLNTVKLLDCSRYRAFCTGIISDSLRNKQLFDKIALGRLPEKLKV